MATSQVKEPETASAQKPVKTIRLRGVSASIFANHAKSEGRDITFHKVSLQRAYKDGNDWKHTTSFGRDDLPLLKKAVDQAWDFILGVEAASRKDQDSEL